MFICDECLKKDYDNTIPLFKSYGRCECCGHQQNCNDIPSLFLRPIDRNIYFCTVYIKQGVGTITGTKEEINKIVQEMNEKAGEKVYYNTDPEVIEKKE